MEVGYIPAKNNEDIIDWVESHGGKPAILDDPEIVEDKIGLRINWKGTKDESMLSESREITREITWDRFFSIMKNQELLFMYSKSDDVSPTLSYKFIKKYSTPK